MTPSSLQTEADFDQALSEVNALLADQPAADTDAERRVNELLSHLANFHEAQPPERQSANFDRLQALDDQLKAFGRHWRRQNPGGQTEHWSPMLGGDIDPQHGRR